MGNAQDIAHRFLSEALSAINVRADPLTRRCVYHLKLAIRAHRELHREPPFRPRRDRGGLTPIQAEKARTYIMERLDRRVSTAELAAACALSRGHFSRAFKLTFGVPPHQFQLERRIDLARRLLTDAKYSLADVAIDCGFNDQPHFTRVFKLMTSTTPYAWQRQMLLR
jgi:AraC-like DNA-binding protein